MNWALQTVGTRLVNIERHKYGLTLEQAHWGLAVLVAFQDQSSHVFDGRSFLLRAAQLVEALEHFGLVVAALFAKMTTTVAFCSLGASYAFWERSAAESTGVLDKLWQFLPRESRQKLLPLPRKHNSWIRPCPFDVGYDC